jgi:hypothetical protein
MDSTGIEDAPKATSEVPLIRSLFLRRTLNNEMEEITEKICDMKSRNKTVDKKLKLIQNEIKAEANSGIDVCALTREKEACQKHIVELAAKRKRMAKEHEKDAVSKEMCENQLNEQELAFLNIPYWEETLSKSSKVT